VADEILAGRRLVGTTDEHLALFVSVAAAPGLTASACLNICSV
jgi:hypothetical protein